MYTVRYSVMNNNVKSIRYCQGTKCWQCANVVLNSIEISRKQKLQESRWCIKYLKFHFKLTGLFSISSLKVFYMFRNLRCDWLLIHLRKSEDSACKSRIPIHYRKCSFCGFFFKILGILFFNHFTKVQRVLPVPLLSFVPIGCCFLNFFRSIGRNRWVVYLRCALIGPYLRTRSSSHFALHRVV